jgi:hypothetical protein
MSRARSFDVLSRFRPLARLTAETELVIDGFQRSGNTFAQVAFELAQSRPVRIAHHTHAAGHVLLAARRGLPTLLAIRDPRSTTISYVQYYPGVSMTAALLNYTLFYRACLAVREQVVVAPFDDIVSDMGRVIDRLNARYGTSYARFEHSGENVERCFAVMEQRWALYGRRLDEVVPRPSAVRAARRAALEERYEDLHPRIRRMADDVYRRTVAP